MKYILLALLSGCLYTWHSDDNDEASNYETGMCYDCRYFKSGAWHHQDICGPLALDPDYVVNHFDPGNVDPYLDTITCEAEPSKLCLFKRED